MSFPNTHISSKYSAGNKIEDTPYVELDTKLVKEFFYLLFRFNHKPILSAKIQNKSEYLL